MNLPCPKPAWRAFRVLLTMKQKCSHSMKRLLVRSRRLQVNVLHETQKAIVVTLLKFRLTTTDSQAFDSFSDSGDSSSDIDDQESVDLAEDKGPNDNSLQKSFSAQEEACMAILSSIARHCITTEAAKDIIDLFKLLCPGNELLQSLSYANVYQVCGNCSVFVYDICERCLGLSPADVGDQVICSTPGCDRCVLIRALWIVHNFRL